MSLETGSRLGSYEIVAPLGAGGKGEVYGALDTTLDREVAITALPEGFSQDPEHMARFEREDKALAALNHPNVATLFGFGKARLADSDEAAGPVPAAGPTARFLVMELVEGEALAERIKRGPILIDEAIDLFQQIAG